MQAFALEFPDALDLLVGALRAGLSFSAAMQMVSEESPEPVRTEFSVTVEEQALGLDFREALLNLTRRVDSLDLRFFVTAVVLQRETGGNLAEILENTARLIRDRFRVLGDIRTFTAQGRLTGAILVLLPVVMALYTYTINPDYFPAHARERRRPPGPAGGRRAAAGRHVRDPQDRHHQGVAMFLLIFSGLVFAAIAIGAYAAYVDSVTTRSPVAARLRELRAQRAGGRRATATGRRSRSGSSPWSAGSCRRRTAGTPCARASCSPATAGGRPCSSCSARRSCWPSRCRCSGWWARRRSACRAAPRSSAPWWPRRSASTCPRCSSPSGRAAATRRSSPRCPTRSTCSWSASSPASGSRPRWQRVAAEMRIASPVLAGELALVNQEMQTGLSRTDALRNLAERTGVEDIYSLVAMLIQTDRLGTSVGQALRAHADSMRTKRRQRAEQLARKATVKLAFPLVLMIFPALLLVLLGPAAIQLMRALTAS